MSERPLYVTLTPSTWTSLSALPARPPMKTRQLAAAMGSIALMLTALCSTMPAAVTVTCESRYSNVTDTDDPVNEL